MNVPPDRLPGRGPEPAPEPAQEPTRDPKLTVAIIGAGRLGRSLARRAARAGFRVYLEDVLPSNLRRAREELHRGLAAEKKAEGANHPASEACRSLTPGRSQDASRTSAPEEPSLDELNLAELSFAEPNPAELFPAQPNLAQSSQDETVPIAFVASIEDAVRPASLVIDCVPDELESKLEILWLLDRMAPPHAVFLTPTRALSIADLAACTYRPDKCVALALTPADLEPLDRERCACAPIELRTTPATSQETLALLERFWRALGFEPVFRPQA
jgi:3-hydroxybutyryl-CoA dehydrogenase